MWNYVIPHFTGFLEKLQLSQDHRMDAEGKARRIAQSLSARYYPSRLLFDPGCYMIVGSYGKRTAIQPLDDLDMLFFLPDEVFGRIQAHQGNRQSNLLREIKDALIETFPRTDLSADGQIILAPFDSCAIEIVPAFRLPMPNLFLTPHTGNGGTWRRSSPAAEYRYLNDADLHSNGKATHLTMMLKAWNRECNVGLKSVSLEILAAIFIDQWNTTVKTIYWYDWMMRDFFDFMRQYVNGWTRILGTEEIVQLGEDWATKLETAHARATKACEYEHADNGLNGRNGVAQNLRRPISDRHALHPVVLPGGQIMDAAREPIHATARELYGRLVYTHLTHEKEREIWSSKVCWMSRGNIALTAATTFLAIISATLKPTWAIYATAISSLFTVGFVMWQSNFDPSGKESAHRITAKELLWIREQLLLLITQCYIPGYSQQRLERTLEMITRELTAVYKFAPNTSTKAYEQARGALEAGHLTFTDQEIDRLLPPYFRGGEGGE